MNASPAAPVPSFETSPDQLLVGLYRAWKEARLHKRQRDYQLRFERNAEAELLRLRDAILSGRYHPAPSNCFVIHDPKMREVFAAHFRDRIVHHLLYDMIAPFLIPGFIRDSYSCIPGRGTHDGIRRLEQKIIKVSGNYSQPCYILKLDIKGYFMNIRRDLLLQQCLRALEPHRQQLDFPMVKFLLERIILDDPTSNCHRIGPLSDWDGLPASKSLFCSPPGCGLPIGNLTSQLFSNVYLDVFDKYMVLLVGVDRYGRYVDDAYVVGANKGELRRLISLARVFLQEMLGLALSPDKIAIYSAYRGVEFLGAYLKPFRTYVGNHCLERMEKKIKVLHSEIDSSAGESAMASDALARINSFLGLTSHYRAYRIRLRWAYGPMVGAFQYGYFTSGLLKLVLKKGLIIFWGD